MELQSANAYTDGSYNPNNHLMGCAIILYDGADKRPHRIVFTKQLKSQNKYGSNIAEIVAVKTAIKTALSLKFTRIFIYHDWSGLNYFSTSENIKSRHNKCPNYANYAKYIEKSREVIEIIFVKVKAHSDNEYNCLADKMARTGKVN